MVVPICKGCVFVLCHLILTVTLWNSVIVIPIVDLRRLRLRCDFLGIYLMIPCFCDYASLLISLFHKFWFWSHVEIEETWIQAVVPWWFAQHLSLFTLLLWPSQDWGRARGIYLVCGTDLYLGSDLELTLCTNGRLFGELYSDLFFQKKRGPVTRTLWGKWHSPSTCSDTKTFQ